MGALDDVLVAQWKVSEWSGFRDFSKHPTLDYEAPLVFSEDSSLISHRLLYTVPKGGHSIVPSFDYFMVQFISKH